MSWEDIKSASMTCPEIEGLRGCLRSNVWSTCLPAFCAASDELCEYE